MNKSFPVVRLNGGEEEKECIWGEGERSKILSGREPKSCRISIFNFKLGHFVAKQAVRVVYERPSLELKAWFVLLAKVCR